MSPSAKTVRLQNRTSANLSLTLTQLRAPASPSLRRSAVATPISIQGGMYYDVCAGLDLSFEAAVALIERSPEVKAFKNAGHLDIIIFPPEPVAESPKVAPPKVEAAPAPVVEAPPEEAAAEAPAVAVEAPAEPAAPTTGSEPTMAWSESELRSYAKAHDIDVSKAKSKTAVLRTIREAG